jgi:hypothetical protein
VDVFDDQRFDADLRAASGISGRECCESGEFGVQHAG